MQGNPDVRPMPDLPLMGGCQCGNVRYRIVASPIVFYHCHCRECQRQTSSAFGQSLRVRAEDFQIEGTVARTEWLAESGMRRIGHFCTACGVRLVHGGAVDATLNVKAGTLDDTSWLVPGGHIWTRSCQPHARPRPDELAYERSPEDGFAALAQRWRQLVGL